MLLSLTQPNPQLHRALARVSGIKLYVQAPAEPSGGSLSSELPQRAAQLKRNQAVESLRAAVARR